MKRHSTKEIRCLISELDKDTVPYAIPIHMAAGAIPSPPSQSSFRSCSEHLILLALPLEAECLVNPEFSGDGKEGHADGNAANTCQTTIVIST